MDSALYKICRVVHISACMHTSQYSCMHLNCKTHGASNNESIVIM